MPAMKWLDDLRAMINKEQFYPETRFGGFSDVDGTVIFFNRVNSLVNSSSVVLDVGCGRGAYCEDAVAYRRSLRVLRGKAARVIGIDVDQGAQVNPFLDEFHLIRSRFWPIGSDSIDLALCDNVLEHIERLDEFLMEIRRVLKDGGFLCIRTPNQWSYAGLSARLIPNKYHAKVILAVQGRKEEDVFPTVYRCNSIRKLKGIMKKNGFEHVVYGYEAEPSYLKFSGIAYSFGMLHRRLAPAFLKPVIFAFGKIKKVHAMDGAAVGADIRIAGK